MFKSLSLSAPWYRHYEMVFNLLDPDPEVKVSTELTLAAEGCYNFNILSSNPAKLEGLKKVLRTNITFNNIILRMTFINLDTGLQLGEENGAVIPTEEDWKNAFTGNPNFVGLQVGVHDWNYGVFAHTILDFYADDLRDICGYRHMLPAQIVEEVCRFVEGDAGIIPCTETPKA